LLNKKNWSVPTTAKMRGVWDTQLAGKGFFGTFCKPR